MREVFYKFCDDANAVKTVEFTQETEDSLSRNYENFNNTEIPDVRSFVKNSRDQEMLKTKLLSGIVVFEKDYSNERVFEQLNLRFTYRSMDLEMKTNNAKIISLVEKYDEKTEHD